MKYRLTDSAKRGLKHVASLAQADVEADQADARRSGKVHPYRYGPHTIRYTMAILREYQESCRNAPAKSETTGLASAEARSSGAAGRGGDRQPVMVAAQSGGKVRRPVLWDLHLRMAGAADRRGLPARCALSRTAGDQHRCDHTIGVDVVALRGKAGFALEADQGYLRRTSR